ncbi:hypothetical protein AVEN_176210-1 [Araneus ventricosus]|uniref:Uncharacterized protein n=1 Tax=Araneus ventricosus TaxID=182803 RepID=A0A4Y2M8A5_ARAVE|nr:hypothetical protein AVEN_176210-1 [Araneus ventricosus]
MAVTNEIGNDDKEDDDDDDDDTVDPPSQSLLTSQEPLQSVQSLWAFFSSLSSTNDDHFRALDSMQTLISRRTALEFGRLIVNKERNYFSPQAPETARVQASVEWGGLRRDRAHRVNRSESEFKSMLSLHHKS